MVKKALQFIGREIKGMHEAAYLLAAFAIISQILGLVRDRLLASQFGAGELLDVYYASFKVPDFIYTIITAFVSISIIVPFLVKFESGDHAKQKKFVDTMFTTLIFFVIVLSLGAFLFLEKILGLFFSDLLNGPMGADLLMISRIMLIQPAIFAISSLFSSIVQTYKKFFIYALSPVVYNLGIIIGIIAFYPKYGILGLAYGVVLGAIFHLLIQLPSVKSNGLLPKITFKPDMKSLKKVLMVSLPRTFSLAGNQISLIILLSIAGTLTAGSIAIFSFSFNLQGVPMAIIGLSYSLAAFPLLTRLFEDKNFKEFTEQIARATRHIIFWSVPVMVMFIVLRAQIVRTILGAGEFSWNDTRLVAAALAIFSISVVAQSLILLFVRGYYAAGQTKKPLIFSLISIAVTIFSAFWLTSIFESNAFFRDFIEGILRVADLPGTVVLMLPLAYSLGVIINLVLLWIAFNMEHKCFSNKLTQAMFHTLASGIIMGQFTYLGLQIFDDIFNLDTLFGIFMQGFLAGIFGLTIGVIVLIILKNEEIHVVWNTFHRKITKAKPVIAEEGIQRDL